MRYVLSILFLCSCGKVDAQDDENQLAACTQGTNPSIEIGHGELRFESFEDGEQTQVELIHGPQGGFHSTIAVRAQQLDPDKAYVISLVGVIDGMELGAGTPLSEFRCNYRYETQEFIGGLLIWDAQPEELHTKQATVNVYVIDPNHQTDDGNPVIVAQDEADFTIWDPALED